MLQVGFIAFFLVSLGAFLWFARDAGKAISDVDKHEKEADTRSRSRRIRDAAKRLYRDSAR